MLTKFCRVELVKNFALGLLYEPENKVNIEIFTLYIWRKFFFLFSLVWLTNLFLFWENKTIKTKEVFNQTNITAFGIRSPGLVCRYNLFYFYPGYLISFLVLIINIAKYYKELQKPILSRLVWGLE